MNKNEYEKILECLQGTVNNEKKRKQSETFEVRNGKLYRRKKNGKILRVLKEDETDAILFMTHNHETGGHFGIETTYNKIANRYYWKGPYYIHEEIGKGAYKMRTLDGKVLKTSHNVKHIKKYFEMEIVIKI